VIGDEAEFKKYLVTKGYKVLDQHLVSFYCWDQYLAMALILIGMAQPL
jgi:hypothetical protein